MMDDEMKVEPETVFGEEVNAAKAGATYSVSGGNFHEFYQLSDGTPVGKLGAMHYILGENGEKLVDQGFHSVEPTATGYRGKVGATRYEVKQTSDGYKVSRAPRSNRSGVSTVDADLDPEKSVKTGDRLDPEKQRVQDRETIQQTTVGVPGLKANRVIEKYDDENGVETHEYRTELVVLGMRFPMEQGEVKYS